MKTYTQMKSIVDFNKKVLLGALITAGLAVHSSGAFAVQGTAQGELLVTASVPAACTIGNALLDFGSYSPTADRDADTIVAVQCTNGTSFNVYSTTPLDQRVITTGAGIPGEILTYKLYASENDRVTDTQLPVISEVIGTINGIGTGESQAVTVYGRIASGQNVFPGAYVGTANLTIAY